ncbi:MAG: polymerase III, alpha subunit protein [Parcubacteria group bacterium GW2011_GWA2_47_8]|nr:MAG: polymerase III, alpha subunit protein [Parcubacteria group bacterium GW2011_GWA2_47_8]
MDFLGLRNLTIIEETLANIKNRHNIDLDIHALPLNDKNTFKLLQQGNAVGIFQLESDGMRGWLKELKPTELNDIIAMVALYRPGPMELIPNYVARKHGKEEVKYLHPKLEKFATSCLSKKQSSLRV